MTTGAVIFAFDNGQFDYLQLAAAAAVRIRRHLQIPICVITNSEQIPDVFDQVVKVSLPTGGQRYFDDLGGNAEWFNTNRHDAWHLSPWDRTLLVDADYMIASNTLATFLHTNQPLLCHATARDVSDQGLLQGSNTFGSVGMPSWWATVMIFDRSSTAQQIFQCMNMVRQNWKHYCDLFGIGRSAYRNDWALSIAIAIASGHTWKWPSLPWSLATVMPKHHVHMIEPDRFEIKFTDRENRLRKISIAGQDLHVLGKKNLGEMIASTG